MPFGLPSEDKPSVSRLVRGISGVTIWVIGVINLLTKSPDPESQPKIFDCSDVHEAMRH